MATVERSGAGGIFELTFREIAHAPEEVFAWGESIYEDTGVESLVNSIAPTIEQIFRNIGDAISQGGQPPELSEAARHQPGRKS